MILEILFLNFYTIQYSMISKTLYTVLSSENMSYAIISGSYDVESFNFEDESFFPDFDIVLESKSKRIIKILKSRKEFDYLGGYSFREKDTGMRIDLYFDFLNVGYYNYLRIDSSSFVNRKVSDADYIVYQILDPLLKFSEYKARQSSILPARWAFTAA